MWRNGNKPPTARPPKRQESWQHEGNLCFHRQPTPNCIGFEGLQSAINPKQDQTHRKLNYNSPIHRKAASAQRHRALQAKTKGNTHHVFKQRGFEPRALKVWQADTARVPRDPSPKAGSTCHASRRSRPVQRSPRCRPPLSSICMFRYMFGPNFQVSAKPWPQDVKTTSPPSDPKQSGILPRNTKAHP